MPIEQRGKSLSFYARFTRNGVGATDLAIKADIFAPNDTAVVSAADATHVSRGRYKVVLASNNVITDGLYFAEFYVSSGTADQSLVTAYWSVGSAGVNYLDSAISSTWDALLVDHVSPGSMGQALASAGIAGDPLIAPVPGVYANGTAGHALGLIGTGQGYAVVPVVVTGEVVIIQGDSYTCDHDRALQWIDSSGMWPELENPDHTPAAVYLRTRTGTGATNLLSKTGTVLKATGVNKKVQFEIEVADTLPLKLGAWPLIVEAHYVGGDIVTLVLTRITIKPRVLA